MDKTQNDQVEVESRELAAAAPISDELPGVPPAGTRLTLPRWGDVRFYYAAPSGFPELAAAEKISDLTCFSILINYEKQN